MDNTQPSFLDASGKYTGIRGWIFSTDHKRIGILYLISMMTFFLTGVVLGLLMRLELIAPGPTIMSAQTYNAAFTVHGVIMIFLFIIPGIPAVFGNFFLPIHIGAKDVFFPRLNLLSWWLFITGGVLAVVSLFAGGGPVDTGWTFYAPYSIRTGTDVSLAVFAAFVIGCSSILTGVNFITTIHRLRAPGMDFFRMPLFSWSLYATGWIQILATPVIGITLLLVICERFFGVGFFDPLKGGDPLLFQHLFWIYSHPAVYVMIIPAMGVVSEIIPVFSQKNVFGYKTIAYSSLAIAFIGFFVWGHHMFTSGISDTSRVFFSVITFIVAVPSGLKVFNWVATLYKGSIELVSPFLYTLSFIFLFSLGGLLGLVNGALATNIHIHDTYFIVGHFHYVMFGGTAIAFFGGLHYWFPKMFGKNYNERRAVIAWVVLFIGFNLLYFPMLVLGWEGMPRRYYDYLPEFQTGNVISTVGSWILVSGLILMLSNLVSALIKGEKAEMNPWDGTTLEWTISSPPPHHNFEKIPVIEHGPYEFRRGAGGGGKK
ncbi:MAG: cytochrome c oxidase subunit I [Candidatus Schekmanbacteria bacterium]|nr:cytochrome c oxidase subunit I [Candidatus Schekmanbacteria bacterium]